MKLKDLFSKLSPTAKVLLLLAALALGLALLLFGGGDESEGNSLPDEISTEEYAAELERKISELCLQVEGVSNVTVAVSLSGGFEYVYATDSSGRPVTVGSGSSASGIILKRKTPEIAGIGIVCSGGGDPNVKNRLVSLISAAYGVGSNRIFVTEAKKGRIQS